MLFGLQTSRFQNDIKIVVTPLRGNKTLTNDALWKLRAELDIAQFEFNRNHWAFKDRELFPILAKAGYGFRKPDVAQFQNKPLPAPTRRELMAAGKAISQWTHTDLDELLLEAGVPKLKAARAVGSPRDRANTIIEYALANPNVLTAERSMFSAFIVRKALEQQGASSLEKTPTAVASGPKRKARSNDRTPNRVFVVHGQKDAARTAVVDVLRRVGLDPIVLHEQPNMGRHLLTKFIEEAELVPFAVVLMTDDDVGSIKGGKLAARARQNVILELGYFLSHLGQQNVCALVTPGLETPSDFDGIVYIQMDEAGKWQRELVRELKAAGMPLVE